VLSLSDEIGSDIGSWRGVVGEHCDLGRAGLCIGTDDPPDEPLRRRHIDVAGAGHQIHPVALLGAVGEHRDGLGTAHGVNLVDAEKGAGREDRRMRQAAMLSAGRRSDGDRADSGDLGRHDIHHHAGRISDKTTGDIEPHPANRQPALGHDTAGSNVNGGFGGSLRIMHSAGATRGLLERDPQRRIQRGQRVVESLLGDPG
jgi:hypothetical protein